jgi:hypothetical protein
MGEDGLTSQAFGVMDDGGAGFVVRSWRRLRHGVADLSCGKSRLFVIPA